jgi:hypothetical protein
MREYQRTSRKVNFRELPPEIILAFRQYFKKRRLANVEAEIKACCETDSVRLKPGFFSRIFGGGYYVRHSVVFFTDTRIFWCQTDTRDQRTVVSAKFRDIEVTDFDSELVVDHRVQLFGLIDQFPERAQVFLGFEEDPGAQEFIRQLREAGGE